MTTRKPLLGWGPLLVSIATMGAAACSSAPLAAWAAAVEPGGSRADVQIVQSIPLETELAQPDLPYAKDAWVEMARGAKSTIDIGQMYVSNNAGSPLEEVLVELEKAAARGVKIRLIVSARMVQTDPPTLDRIRAMPGAEVRILDLSALTGGIIHAKFWIVDRETSFIGSQNLDWKALIHIHETGIHVKNAAFASQLARIFEIDWAIAGGGQPPTTPAPVAPPEKPLEMELVASPPQYNPEGVRHSLPVLLDLIHGAKRSVRVQLLNYSPVSGEAKFWPDLDNALRAAAVRGVKVELMVSDWNTAKPGIDHLKSLSLIPNAEVRIITIPSHSSGFISYARVIHTKQMVVDDEVYWLGTSNWSSGYFLTTRGVEAVFRRADLAQTGTRIFQKLWTSPYAAKIDVMKEYVPPRRE